ncbi:MAG: ThiF family adenylyltransferase, partial [Parasporobacterium sp.]|nr:ThiF family adenylyltransferase [Parasporobacterium sp.]
MEQRFIRNIPSITEEEQARLNHAHAAVIGLGGLGGAVCEMLTRLGVGELTIAD